MPALRDLPRDHAAFARAFHTGLFSEALPAGVTATAPEEAARRFAVYRNNVGHSLAKALAARFPVIERLVGAEYFSALARAYLAQHPPKSPQLFLWGRDFPAFLAAFPPLAAMPYLAPVARLEWLRGEAYHAADAPPLTPEALPTLAADPARARLGLHPSLRLFEAPCAAVTIWAANQPGAEAREIDATPHEAALVLRDRADTVQVLAATAGDLVFIAALGQGAPLLAAAQAALAQAPGHDAGALLLTLMRHGALTTPNFGEQP